MSTLSIRYGGKHRSVSLGEHPVVVGRAPDCELALKDPALSRRHCRLEPAAGGGLRVTDLGSASGTWLSGFPVSEPLLMLPGDVLRVGATELRLDPGAEPLLSGEPARDSRNLRLFLQSLRACSATTSVSDLLESLLDQALLLAAGDRGAVLLAEPGGALEVALLRDRRDAEQQQVSPALSASFPARVFREGRTRVLTDTEHPSQQTEVTPSISDAGLRSVICSPLPGVSEPVGVLYAASQRPGAILDPADVAMFEALASHAGLAIERARLYEAEKARERAQAARLEAQNEALRAQLGVSAPVGDSPAMRALYRSLERVANSDATVCLQGETGTGKELLARLLHRRSPRSQGPFVVVDCGALPENLIESTLFGHEKGAFTGATYARRGAFEEANGGTVFLDEVGELPLHLQPRLLRVLQEKEVLPLGSNKRRPVEVRVVCATHRDLAAMVEEGSFRRDLFYRLGVISLQVPRLADRGDDVLLLARHFLDRFAAARGVDFSGWTREAAELLLQHPWPGNVRELEQCVQRAVLLGNPPYLRREDFGLGGELVPAVADDAPLPLKEARIQARGRFERAYLADILERTKGNVAEAARLSGVTRQALWHLISKHGIERAAFE